MRILLWAPLIISAAVGGACGCATSPASLPPSAVAPAAPTRGADGSSDDAPTEATSDAPPDAARDIPEDKGRITIENSNADGVSVTDQNGRKITIKQLTYAAFMRQKAPLDSEEVENANVQFGDITADGMTANDVVCRLAPWDVPEQGGLGAVVSTTAVIAFAIQDAVTVAAALVPGDTIKRCGEEIRPRVKWTFVDSQIQSVEVAGVTAAQAKCIEQAMRATGGLNSGACAATLAL